MANPIQPTNNTAPTTSTVKSGMTTDQYATEAAKLRSMMNGGWAKALIGENAYNWLAKNLDTTHVIRNIKQ